MNEIIINLDNLDKKILYELDINSRLPLTVLSKKLHTNRNVIEYRINKLKEKGLIKNFVTLIDGGRLGLTIWNVYLEFQDINPNIEGEIIRFLKDNKKVWWVAQTTGKWNLIYSIFIKDIKEFYNTVREFNGKYGKYILNQEVAAHVEVEVFSRGYFLNKPSIGVTWYKNVEPVILDDKDKKILKELASNSRISSVELAGKTKTTARIVTYRIKELMKKGVITRFRLQIDSSKIGFNFYKIIVYLKNLSRIHDKELEEYCKNLGNIFHFERKIGPWMLELEMDSESYEKANQILKKMKEDFSDYIKSYEVLMIVDEPKGELDLTQQL
jgi:DNA-binding Lrp family transcriptional regulator